MNGPRFPQQSFIDSNRLHTVQRPRLGVVISDVRKRDSSLQKIVGISSYILSLRLSCFPLARRQLRNDQPKRFRALPPLAATWPHPNPRVFHQSIRKMCLPSVNELMANLVCGAPARYFKVTSLCPSLIIRWTMISDLNTIVHVESRSRFCNVRKTSATPASPE